MRAQIALLGFYHETNSFAATRTTFADFQAYQYAEGGDVIERYRGTGTELGGMIAAADAADIELLPILFAAAVPSGLITAEAFELLMAKLTAGLAATASLDGVLAVLHGAAVADGAPDADGAMLAALRQTVGADRPIVATTDFHANISKAMVETADVIVGYDTYPHVDMAARGAEAVGCLRRLLDGEHLHSAYRKLPLVTVPPCQSTDDDPMSGLLAAMHDLEHEPGVVTMTTAMGFAYADVPDLGAAVLAYGTDQAAVDRAADAMTETIWRTRKEFTPALTPPDGIADLIGKHAPAPLVLVDPADNLGGGSAGDGTVILEALLKAGAEGAVVVLADAEAAAAAAAVGVGGRFRGEVGAKADRLHGTPVMIDGRVTFAAPARFRHSGSYMTGFVTDMGLCAVIETDDGETDNGETGKGEAGGVRIVLTTLRTMPFDIEQLRAVGIEPADQRIIVVKSAIAWRAAYGAIAARSILIDCPGVCPANLARLDYKSRPRPLFPLEPDAVRRKDAPSS
ncbi:MAG: M81 family metallopeptidase [Alphaproteobacteria bacterium]